MEFKWIIGIDVSKKTFDVAYAVNTVNAKQAHAVFANDLKGFKTFSKWLKDQGVTPLTPWYVWKTQASTTGRWWPIYFRSGPSYG